MEYRYETFRKDNRAHVDTSSRFEDVEIQFRNDQTVYVKVYSGLTDQLLSVLDNEDAWESWRERLERRHAWKPEVELEKMVGPDAEQRPWEWTQDTDIQISVDEEEFVPTFLKGSSSVNPSHYKGYLDDMQWLETMARIVRFRDPVRFKAALELQVRKYLDRLGSKDDEIKELEKSLWYLKYWVAYVKNGNQPVRICDVDKFIEESK